MPVISPTSIPQLARMLEPYFISSSLGTPPNAQGNSGNRTIVATDRPPEDQADKALVGGSVTWTFTTKFNKPPLVSFAPVGTPPTSGGVPAALYISTVAPNAVTIKSTNATDTRVLHLTAKGNPN